MQQVALHPAITTELCKEMLNTTHLKPSHRPTKEENARKKSRNLSVHLIKILDSVLCAEKKQKCSTQNDTNYGKRLTCPFSSLKLSNSMGDRTWEVPDGDR